MNAVICDFGLARVQQSNVLYYFSLFFSFSLFFCLTIFCFHYFFKKNRRFKHKRWLISKDFHLDIQPQKYLEKWWPIWRIYQLKMKWKEMFILMPLFFGNWWPENLLGLIVFFFFFSSSFFLFFFSFLFFFFLLFLSI